MVATNHVVQVSHPQLQYLHLSQEVIRPLDNGNNKN